MAVEAISSSDTSHMYENEYATRLEALFARALRVQLSDQEQEAARVQLEVDAAKCRCGGMRMYSRSCAC
jgi:hypothetical protein